jgi:thiol-disulfide isomerase/thioredoxin
MSHPVRRICRRLAAGVFAVGLAGAAGSAWAAGLNNADAVPQLGPRGVDGYREFLASEPHRAFAIAPGGAWAWRAGLPSRELAEQAALDDCRANTAHSALPCVLYAADDQRVFDALAWPKLWGPYASRQAAERAAVGVRRGERFPDLRFRMANGSPAKVSDFRGKVLVLHFWGSWCGPCRRELPDLQQLAAQFAGHREVRFIFLPVREPFAVARAWAQDHKLALPLADSGVTDSGEPAFVLADGSRLPDRQVAGKFPTTYVLDKRGVVVFSHVGDASRWPDYAPFLRDVVARSGG